jgi:hypothetical protein
MLQKFYIDFVRHVDKCDYSQVIQVFFVSILE